MKRCGWESGRDTLLVHAGSDPGKNFGIVNPPVYRASTVLFKDMEEFRRRGERRYRWFSYGTDGTPTTFALTDAVCRLEGGAGTLAFSSGLAAITLSILALVRSGDHILMVDSVYGPTRRFCDQVLKGFGVETTYYDPLVGAGIAGLIQDHTRLIFTESPGSLSFEVQDIPAICAAAHGRGVPVAMDNTWATPLFFDALGHGVDISIQAGTKYLGGHSDLLLGLVTTRDEELFKRLKDTRDALGDCVAPDVCSLALRGMRTMGLRLRHQQQAALELARWLEGRPEVRRVLHPALEGDPGHDLWRRDFTGSSGLFGIILDTEDETARDAFIDALELFGIGFSWGGFESLVVPADPAPIRTARPWQEPGLVVRLNVGLEDIEDLKADLERGFARMRSA